jgi:hypothetical protein
MIMPLIKKQIAEIHGIMSSAENLVTQILANEVNSQTYSELSDTVSLLEIFETRLREKRQLMNLKLRKYYLNQYLELHKKKPFSSIIIRD